MEALIDSVCADDDSSFYYLFRGITPSKIVGGSNPIIAHPHGLVYNLLKINGGCEVFRSGTKYYLDYRTKTSEDYVTDPPILMLPSRHQDYTDDYFVVIFPKAVRLLRETSVLVIVGYSLPEDDALLRFIIRQFAEDEADAVGKEIYYIDLAPATQLREKL